MAVPPSRKKEKEREKKSPCCKVLLANPGEARGCSTNSLVINSLSEPFPPTALRCRHSQAVRDSTSRYKLDYVIMIKNFLNSEGHQNPFSGSEVTAILLKGWILPIGGASAGEGLFISEKKRKKILIYKVVFKDNNYMHNIYVAL